MKIIISGLFLFSLVSCATPRREYKPEVRNVNGCEETVWDYNLNNFRRNGELEKERLKPRKKIKYNSCEYTCLGR